MDHTARPEPSPDETSAPEPRSPDAPSGDMISVVLIEDNRLVREGITSVLHRLGDMRVVASEPVDHERMALDVTPDVVLLDVGLEARHSLDVARRVMEDFPDAGVIVMDLLPAADDIVDYISLGVSGFIMKDAPLDEVARTIRAVAAGHDVLPDAMTATLFSEIAREVGNSGGSEHLDSVRLTAREGEVIGLIAEGMSNKAIARNLHISIHTVKSHLRNIMEKLNLHSRLQLARYVDDVQDEAAAGE